MIDERWEIWQGCTLLLALAALTDAQRHAVVGRHLRGLSHRELAVERGVSTSAVYLAEIAALDRLRGRLELAAMGSAA